jgi:hypothetical protein
LVLCRFIVFSAPWSYVYQASAIYRDFVQSLLFIPDSLPGLTAACRLGLGYRQRKRILEARLEPVTRLDNTPEERETWRRQYRM